MVTVRVGLDPLGLHHGEDVRFRSRTSGRWQNGTVAARETDGSVRVTDADGRSRSLLPDQIEVHCRGRRGAQGWEPLLVRAGRAEQLRLL
jgi:hypothetical protein